MRRRNNFWAGACAVAAAVSLLGWQTPGADAQVAPPTCDASAYQLGLQSLTGPPRADLVVRITATVPDCELPETLTSLQVVLQPFKGSPARTLLLSDVPSPAGTATVNLGRVPRLRKVQATVTFGPQ